MEFLLLADAPSAVETVADWYFEQWCKDSGRYSKVEVIAKLSGAMHRDKLPQLILCRLAGEWVAAAELKIAEMDIFPDYEFWLGGVYVAEQARGRGVASALIEQALQRARQLGIDTLYLQTEQLDGGLYRQHGFEAVAQVHNHGVEVLVMKAQISS